MLLEWPLCIIKDVDIATIVFDSASKRYALVNRALKKGTLTRLRRGLYLIGKPFTKNTPSNLQIAHSLYGPSYISFESALFYHQLIPEAVYTTTSATTKRTKEFTTPIGVFQYTHVPKYLSYLGVQIVEVDNETFLIANPWKALADHFYVYNRNWNRPEDICLDMRIEQDEIEKDLTTLQVLSENYDSIRVRKFLNKMLKGLVDGTKNN